MEHGARDVIVGDDAILQGAVRRNVVRRAAYHVFRLTTYSKHRIVRRRQGHDGRLINDKIAAGNVDDGIRRSEVYADLPNKHSRDSIRYGRIVKIPISNITS